MTSTKGSQIARCPKTSCGHFSRWFYYLVYDHVIRNQRQWVLSTAELSSDKSWMLSRDSGKTLPGTDEHVVPLLATLLETARGR